MGYFKIVAFLLKSVLPCPHGSEPWFCESAGKAGRKASPLRGRMMANKPTAVLKDTLGYGRFWGQ